MPAPPSLPIPEDIVLRLKSGYDALPPKQVRWLSRSGQDFLKLLRWAVEEFGVRQCAESVGVSTQSIYGMLRQPIRVSRYPKGKDLVELRQAWAVAEERNRDGRQVRRDSHEFEQVHLALADLSGRYDLQLIAAAIEAPVWKLRRFLLTPTVSKKEGIELSLLVHAYRDSQHGDRGLFLRALHQTQECVSVTKIARALEMSVTDVIDLVNDMGSDDQSA